jgi:hypothetical protein
MKRSTLKSLTTAVAAALALGAGTALAALPPLKHQGEVQYLTGGVGKDESDAIEQAQSKFPLALEFVQKATPHDEFVANVDVRVLDPHGRNVLDARADGPFLLAKVPSGEYTVKATYEGQTLEKKVRVSNHGSERAVFVWATAR